MPSMTGQAMPDNRTAVAMHTAHRLDDLTANLAHASEHLQAARRARGQLRTFHAGHVAVHLGHALDAGHALAANLRQHYPAEGAEYDATSRAIGLAKALSDAARTATTAHLAQSILYDLGHASRHADVLLTPGSPALWRFNADHCDKHLASAEDHAVRLAVHLRDNYPAEARYLAALPVGALLPRRR